MKICVNFNQVEAYGEDCRLWSLFSGHVLIYKSVHRFRWMVEIL